MPKPIVFASPEEFRSWLKTHHTHAAEVLVGFYKKNTGKPSLTWPESVDCALCFGWIDGIRKSLGDEGYTVRFTPRKPTSTWSAINIRRVAELEKVGLMQPAGRKAFERRKDTKSAIYLRAGSGGQAERHPGKNVSLQESGVGILSGAAAWISQKGDPLGHQRQEGRDEHEGWQH